MFLNVDNVGAERMSSGRLFQATGPATQNARLPSCSLVLGRPNHHEQRNGEQKGWEKWKLECTSRSDNMVQGCTLPRTPICNINWRQLKDNDNSRSYRITGVLKGKNKYTVSPQSASVAFHLPFPCVQRKTELGERIEFACATLHFNH